VTKPNNVLKSLGNDFNGLFLKKSEDDVDNRAIILILFKDVVKLCEEVFYLVVKVMFFWIEV